MSNTSTRASSASPGHLVLRADASSTIGTGHVMRCIALAEAWNARGGHSHLVSFCESGALQSRIRASSIRLVELPPAITRDEDISQTCGVAQAHGAAPVVLDGYGFDSACQESIKTRGLPLAVLDDFGHTSHYAADIVINQNLDTENLAYSREPYTRVLLGARYVILRNEFARWRTWRRVVAAKARRILVTLGGSDPANTTFGVIQAMDAIPDHDLEVLVVVGSSNPHRNALVEAAAAARAKVRLEFDSANMAERMAWADLAVAAGGTTCWELAFMGLPSAIIILADNQRRSAEALAAHAAATLVGTSHAITPENVASAVTELAADQPRRERMSVAGRSVVDGLGADRVVDAITEISKRV